MAGGANENSGRPEVLVALAAFLVLVGAAIALMRTNLATAMIPVGFAVAATVGAGTAVGQTAPRARHG